jgi:hypothetical protein
MVGNSAPMAAAMTNSLENHDTVFQNQTQLSSDNQVARRETRGWHVEQDTTADSDDELMHAVPRP